MGYGTTIAMGPGNPTGPPSEVIKLKCAGTIAKGKIVGFDLSAADGFSIVVCTATTVPGFGVALEAGVTGDWINIVISGWCALVTNNGTDVVAGDLLCGGASGEAVPVTAAEIGAADAVYPVQVIGQALTATTGTSCTSVVIWKKI